MFQSEQFVHYEHTSYKKKTTNQPIINKNQLESIY